MRRYLPKSKKNKLPSHKFSSKKKRKRAACPPSRAYALQENTVGFLVYDLLQAGKIEERGKKYQTC